jgi:alpha 1,2-mannosyltransferase
MCRWNSLFFSLHPALSSYTHYWRVEPDVHFFCHIPYDPFAFLAAHNMVYGFNMAILEDARSFPSLWRVTLDFVQKYPELLHPDADVEWLVDAANGGGYNNCQFFSNFEIGDLRFWRSENVQRYLRWLDESGGFWYERFGDAPIHTLAVSLFAGKGQVWFFRDVGYQHDMTRHCPSKRVEVKHGKGGVGGEGGGGERCACEPTGLDKNFYELVPMESPQRKPGDTCIRNWLGGEWLKKREGWNREVEVALGGDGYGGYVRG